MCALYVKQARIEQARAFCRKNGLTYSTPAIFDKIYRFLVHNYPAYREQTLKADAKRVVELLSEERKRGQAA
jgi:hypothetical protein